MYRLNGYSVRHPEDESYPKFHTFQTAGSIHRTFEEAKARIDEIVANAEVNNNYIKWHAFFIAEGILPSLGINQYTKLLTI